MSTDRFIDIIEEEIEVFYILQKGCRRFIKEVKKSVWGMPWLLEAKKDVVSCEKHWGFANEI